MNSKFQLFVILITWMSFCACQEEPKTNNMEKETEKTNPMICDTATGLCEMPNADGPATTTNITPAAGSKIKLVYFTDPICSSCWGIEPQLRKLKLEYGNSIDIEYRMGGLLPDWNYNSGGISKPSDVASHWDEVSIHYDMPIDGDVWLEDPLNSSYPPSIAFKAAQLQSKELADLFMREIREMVFLKKINIARWDNLAIAAKTVGLDVVQMKTDFDGKAKLSFEKDLKMASEFGVKGFPTIYFMDDAGNQEIVYGSKPYAFYETAILKLNAAVVKSEYSKNWETLFAKYPSLTAKEFSVLSGTPRIESEDVLNELTTNGALIKTTTKNGAIWHLK